MNRSFKWWLKCCIHNILVHPWLPLADLLEKRWSNFANFIYWAHDRTAPVGGG